MCFNTEKMRTNLLYPRDICALVITYNPGTGFQQRLQRITQQVARTVIVDNGSVKSVLDMLQTLPEEMNIELIINHENLGVAHALNQGVAWADHNGFECILTMDQDSVVKNDMVEKLSEICNCLPPEASVGVIGSNYCDQYGKYWIPKMKTNSAWIEQPFVITSGCLMSVIAFFAVGGVRDDLFIDQVDADYCIRLRKQGYMVCMSTEPLMTHSIGNKTRHKFFGVYLYTSNHNAFRRYYMTRNRITLAKNYFLSEPMFVMRGFYHLISDIITIIFLEKEKAQKLRAVIIGLLDGLAGRMGKIKA